jgi:hypothetical protein
MLSRRRQYMARQLPPPPSPSVKAARWQNPKSIVVRKSKRLLYLFTRRFISTVCAEIPWRKTVLKAIIESSVHKAWAWDVETATTHTGPAVDRHVYHVYHVYQSPKTTASRSPPRVPWYLSCLRVSRSCENNWKAGLVHVYNCSLLAYSPL